MKQTVEHIRHALQQADVHQFETLERIYRADTRKGVIHALYVARRRLEHEQAEAKRLASLYSFEEELADGGIAVGLDEVGRGPIAGPLTVGAVVLPHDPEIPGLNDSKQVSPDDRRIMADRIKEIAHAWAIEHIPPETIDEQGMSACLREAFTRVVADVEAQGVTPHVVLLDGNPLHIDAREKNIVKGDARCASIAAASIIAKVERDSLMCEYAQQYPQYGWDKNKGYGSKDHIEAIREYGLTPLHRASFCSGFVQETLF